MSKFSFKLNRNKNFRVIDYNKNNSNSNNIQNKKNNKNSML